MSFVVPSLRGRDETHPTAELKMREWWIHVGLICIPLVAVYLHIPPPQLSPALQKWHSAGEAFHFRGREIFYRGKRQLVPNPQCDPVERTVHLVVVPEFTVMIYVCRWTLPCCLEMSPLLVLSALRASHQC